MIRNKVYKIHLREKKVYLRIAKGYNSGHKTWNFCSPWLFFSTSILISISLTQNIKLKISLITQDFDIVKLDRWTDIKLTDYLHINSLANNTILLIEYFLKYLVFQTIFGKNFIFYISWSPASVIRCLYSTRWNMSEHACWNVGISNWV